MWVLIGYGPNDLKIPALVWGEKEKAVTACKANCLAKKYRTVGEGDNPTVLMDD